MTSYLTRVSFESLEQQRHHQYYHQRQQEQQERNLSPVNHLVGFTFRVGCLVESCRWLMLIAMQELVFALQQECCSSEVSARPGFGSILEQLGEATKA